MLVQFLEDARVRRTEVYRNFAACYLNWSCALFAEHSPINAAVLEMPRHRDRNHSEAGT
jgi:hypothetical protein